MRKIEETQDKEDKIWGQEVVHKLCLLPSVFPSFIQGATFPLNTSEPREGLGRYGPQHGCSRENKDAYTQKRATSPKVTHDG